MLIEIISRNVVNGEASEDLTSKRESLKDVPPYIIEHVGELVLQLSHIDMHPSTYNDDESISIDLGRRILKSDDEQDFEESSIEAAKAGETGNGGANISSTVSNALEAPVTGATDVVYGLEIKSDGSVEYFGQQPNSRVGMVNYMPDGNVETPDGLVETEPSSRSRTQPIG